MPFCFRLCTTAEMNACWRWVRAKSPELPSGPSRLWRWRTKERAWEALRVLMPFLKSAPEPWPSMAGSLVSWVRQTWIGSTALAMS